MSEEAQPLRVMDLEIPKGNPFINDRFERLGEIENLTTLIQNYPAPLVFAIDGQWGAGKTTFIRLWQTYLTNLEGPYESIHLNAWECDFTNDPLVALLAQIDQWLKTKRDLSQKAKSSLREMKRALPALAKPIIRALVKVGTLNAVDTNEFLEAVSPDTATDVADQLINQFNSEKTAIESFKRGLGECLDILPEHQKNLIVFIDELDRCRPSFAIELLERVKHLFDIERIVFVLSVNKDQLAKSISGVYGEKFDGLNYLKRFIDLDYSLTIPSMDSFVLNALRSSLVHDYCVTRVRDGQNQYETIELLFKWYAGKFNLTPRDVFQLIKRLGLIVASMDRQIPMNTVVLTVMFFLRDRNPDLYKSLPHEKGKLSDVIHWMYGENLAQTVYPLNAHKIMASLAFAEYDPYDEPESTYVSHYIESFIGKPDRWQSCFHELQKFRTLLQELRTEVPIEDNLRLVAFNQIEKIRHFT